MAGHRPNEDELIARYFGPIAGTGSLNLRDDAALITPSPGEDLVVTTDALVEGMHFFADDRPGQIAQKALRVNLSDLAAKGARPAGFVMALALTPDWQADWMARFAQGLGEDSLAFACPLLGGDTVKTGGPLTIAITALGLVPSGQFVRRTGVEAGDLLYVTGTIGDAAIGLGLRRDGEGDQALALPGTARAFLIDRYLLPQPRLRLAEALRDLAHAGMDVSDGLIGDAAKMLHASGVSGRIELGRVPLSPAAREAIAARPALFETAVTGGDDYELIVALPAARASAFDARARQCAVPVTRIGAAVAGTAAPVLVGLEGEVRHFERASFSHF
jgi:thiamine-monophosphate kinase